MSRLAAIYCLASMQLNLCGYFFSTLPYLNVWLADIIEFTFHVFAAGPLSSSLQKGLQVSLQGEVGTVCKRRKLFVLMYTCSRPLFPAAAYLQQHVLLIKKCACQNSWSQHSIPLHLAVLAHFQFFLIAGWVQPFDWCCEWPAFRGWKPGLPMGLL
jgi:hypothetical protein